MINEKTLRVTGGQGQKKASIKTFGSIGDKRGAVNSVKLFAQGVQTYKKPITSKAMTGGGIRGDVKGWSSASRRRMREYMITHTPPPGMHVCGVTLTIPGPAMDPERAKRLFASFALHMAIDGNCAVWRMEIQQRGQLHWHLICGTKHPADVVMLWHDCIRALGPETFDPPHEGKGSIYTHVENRMCIMGASQHSADTQHGGDRGAWMRYLQDHATKAKQEQIAQGIGRHWGVIGRKHFVSLLPEQHQELTDPQFAYYLRMHQRMATPSEKSTQAPFGRRLRDRLRRGYRGTSTWFGNHETLKRILSASIGASRPISSYADYIRRNS